MFIKGKIMIKLRKRKKLDLKDERFNEFSFFVNKLISAGKASLNIKNDKIIQMHPMMSISFIFGASQKESAFISIESGVKDLFNKIPWKRVFVCHNTGTVYFSAEEDGKPLFALGLKINKSNLTYINAKFMDIKMFDIIDNQVKMCPYDLKRNIKIDSINNIENFFNTFKIKEKLKTF